MKAPWPIDRAAVFDVCLVRRVHVGSHHPTEPGGEIYKPNIPILWTNVHGLGAEELMIVAPPADLMAAQAREAAAAGQGAAGQGAAGAAGRGRGPSISLVGGDICVEFRIRNLLDYVQYNGDPERCFRRIAEAEASRALYRWDVDTLIGMGRMKAGTALRGKIQSAADGARLGVEVIQVGVTGVHPPQQVADAFHETVAAEQERETAIQSAGQFAMKVKTEAAGTAGQADRIAEAISALERLAGAKAPAGDISAKRAEAEGLLSDAGGEVARTIADAVGYRWSRENSERGKAQRFEKELLLYETAPETFRMSYYLGILENGLADGHKYVLVGDRDRMIFRFNFKDTSGQMGRSSALAADGYKGKAR